MPVWQWLLDAAGVLLLLVLLYGVALIVRRRVLSRHGGTFELSYRVRPAQGRARLASRARAATPARRWSGSGSSRSRPRPKRVVARARR